MIEPLLKSQLEPVARRHRQLMARRGLALCWAAAALLGLGFILLQRSSAWGAGFILPLLTIAAVIAAIRIWSRAARWQPDFREIARQIEQRHPELHALLLTAVEQKPEAQTGKLTYLQRRVVQEAVAESRKHRWLDTISDGRLLGMQLANVGALAVLVLILVNLRTATTAAIHAGLDRQRSITVTPGDTSIEKGSGLVVLARFTGPLPPDATLVTIETPDKNRRIPLTKNLADPVFGGSLLEVSADFLYHIEYAGEQTRDFKVRVFEHPRLERADAKISYPDYTGLAEKEIKDTHRVSAVEGSQLDLSLHLNKPVRSAKLIARDKAVIPLVIDPNNPAATLPGFKLEASQTYELQLVDLEGRTNKVPAQFIIDVLKNRPPELKLASPRGDQRVSPIEEIAFQAEAWDDFGLKAYGLTYTIAGGETKTLVLGTNAAANEKRQFSHLLSLEDAGVKPDQLISYFVWADDIGPDGNLRRTAGDMFFAEVRPFEEIFREGQAPESQGGQMPGNESTKLAELQKQIINATWKLQRRETGRKEPSPQYQKDAPVVEQSQAKALEMAEALEERTTDPRAQALVADAGKQMEKALDHLKKAAKSTAPLPEALNAEQAAYQALLKLSAHEYMVTQSRNQSQGQGQANQQQLDQLDLKQKEDRYETQSQASPQQNEEQREQLQILNRLKELAQRQQDLNEKIKELQTALQESKTDEEREDIRRRLKRLREEEQEMLADLDELKQKMEQAKNQSQMADARQQLDKTRSEVQRAAESLDKESVSQALSEGTRAQRDLQQLRDEFRKKNSSQFTDEMRQMRGEARELAHKEEEIGKKLDSLADTKRKTLTDSGETKDLADQLQQQRGGLTNLLEHARSVSEQSETAEPLLSKQLYDTLRQSSQGTAENSLTTSSELLKRSFVNEAGQFEQKARKEIDELKQGVERAAESVLGDDTESLRLAKRELDDLARQVQNEIAEAGPKPAPTPGQGTSAKPDADPSAAQPNGQSQAKQPRAGEPQDQAANAHSAGQEKDQDSANQNAGQPGKPGEKPGQAGQKADNQQGQGAGAQKEDQSKAGQQPGQEGQQGQEAKDAQNGKSPNAQADNNSPKADGNNPAQQAKGQGKGQGRGAGQNAQAQGQQPGGQGQAQASAQRPNGSPPPSPNQKPGEQQNGKGTPPGQQPGGRGQAAQNLFNQPGQQGGNNGAHRPITGTEYTDWSDRLRNVEEVLDLPELRNEVASAREAARQMRIEFKKNGKEPHWDLVRTQIADKLVEVRSRVSEELARRESQEALVPIDRDPVPNKFSDLVRRYYEKLGSE